VALQEAKMRADAEEGVEVMQVPDNQQQDTNI